MEDRTERDGNGRIYPCDIQVGSHYFLYDPDRSVLSV
jgi:hypothetical protein